MSEATHVEIGGRRLEVRWWGPRPVEAPTLVFLHPGLGSASTWRDLPARLAAATGCGAMAYSRDGHGRSEALDEPLGLDHMHREGLQVLPRLIRAVGLEQFVLVGHSDGGSIALIHAGMRGAGMNGPGMNGAGIEGAGTSGARLDAARVGGTGADGAGADGKAMDGKAMDGAGSDTAAGAAAVDSGLRGVATLAAHVFCERLSMRSARRTGEAFERGELQERLAVHHGTKASWVFRSWLDVWTDPQFLAWNLESFLPRIRVPLLVIQGEDDEYGTRAQVDAILSGAPTRARELWLPGCGHAPHRDRPAEVERALAEFVSTSIGQET